MSTIEYAQDLSPLLTPSEASAWLGCSKAWLAQHERELGGVRIAGKPRYPVVGLVERAIRATDSE